MNANELKMLIEDLDKNENIHLLNPLSNDAGFFSTEGKLIYMSFDSFGYKSESIDTDYLSLQLHVPIRAVDNSPTFNDGFYNIIIYKGSFDDSNIESFVNLCTLHASHEYELAFRDFFYALISLFQLPTDQSYKNAVGLFGELKYMQHVAENFKIDISPYWHLRGSLSQFDFSNKEVGIEIKTTSSENASVRIKHEQIFGDYSCYLVTVECEQSDIGESLHEVIVSMQSHDTMFNNLNFAINLEKELKRIAPQQIQELLFQTNQIQSYNAKDINPFPVLPDNVFSLNYDLDLSDSEAISIEAENQMLSDFTSKGVSL